MRVDDLEMRPDVQAAVREIWPEVTTENLADADRHRRLPQRIPQALRVRAGRRRLRRRRRAAHRRCPERAYFSKSPTLSRPAVVLGPEAEDEGPRASSPTRPAFG